jgi:hypothetical protein
MQKFPPKILNYFKYHFLPPLGIIPLHISNGCSNKLLFWHLELSKWHLKIIIRYTIIVLYKYKLHKYIWNLVREKNKTVYVIKVDIRYSGFREKINIYIRNKRNKLYRVLYDTWLRMAKMAYLWFYTYLLK